MLENETNQKQETQKQETLRTGIIGLHKLYPKLPNTDLWLK